MPLGRTPSPARGGYKELLHLEFELYRLHVGRSLTVFYQVCEKDGLIKILEIETIDMAHRLYSISKGDV